MSGARGFPFPGESKKGDSGNATRAWQDRLRSAGLLSHTVSTGVHDSDTAAALKALKDEIGYKPGDDELKTAATEGLWDAWASSDAPEPVGTPEEPTTGDESPNEG